MNICRYNHIFWQLFKADLAVFQQTFWDKLLNAMIWASTVVAITGYIMPAFGLSVEFGAFQAVGVVVSMSGFEVYPQLANFISDIDGDRHVNYLLTLPIPGWLLLVKMACFYTLNALLMAFAALVTSKLILLSRFNMSTIHLGKMILAFIVINAFFGFFTLWMVSLTKSILTMENTMMRVMYPLWFLGGFQFSWHVLHSMSPSLAYINLLNPYIYSFEGMRAATLGQEGYLNYWMCMAVLSAFTLVCGWWGIERLKKRLDFI